MTRHPLAATLAVTALALACNVDHHKKDSKDTDETPPSTESAPTTEPSASEGETPPPAAPDADAPSDGDEHTLFQGAWTPLGPTGTRLPEVVVSGDTIRLLYYFDGAEARPGQAVRARVAEGVFTLADGRIEIQWTKSSCERYQGQAVSRTSSTGIHVASEFYGKEIRSMAFERDFVQRPLTEAELAAYESQEVTTGCWDQRAGADRQFEARPIAPLL